MANQEEHNEYDSEPVVYCANCYSLKIKYEDTIGEDYCGNCGCFDTRTATIEEWEKLYEKKYGQKFTEKTNDPKKSPIFKLSISKLKQKVFESPKWKNIILDLYPLFPQNLGKADSMVLLFDKLIKDNRLDDLRLTLLDYYKRRKYGREKIKSSTEGE